MAATTVRDEIDDLVDWQMRDEARQSAPHWMRITPMFGTKKDSDRPGWESDDTAARWNPEKGWHTYY